MILIPVSRSKGSKSALPCASWYPPPKPTNTSSCAPLAELMRAGAVIIAAAAAEEVFKKARRLNFISTISLRSFEDLRFNHGNVVGIPAYGDLIAHDGNRASSPCETFRDDRICQTYINRCANGLPGKDHLGDVTGEPYALR